MILCIVRSARGRHPVPQLGKQRPDLFAAMLGHENRDLQPFGRLDETNCIGDDPFTLQDRGRQAFLNIDDEQKTVLAVEQDLRSETH